MAHMLVERYTMSRPKTLTPLDKDERFLAQVAWAIYIEGLTQEKVAEKLGATRLRVNKALSEAHRQGLVRISFNTPFAACTELEAGLCARFGFRQAYVAPSPIDPQDTRTVVGAALGNLLSTILADPDMQRFGMSWGGDFGYCRAPCFRAGTPRSRGNQCHGGIDARIGSESL